MLRGLFGGLCWYVAVVLKVCGLLFVVVWFVRGLNGFLVCRAGVMINSVVVGVSCLYWFELLFALVWCFTSLLGLDVVVCCCMWFVVLLWVRLGVF